MKIVSLIINFPRLKRRLNGSDDFWEFSQKTFDSSFKGGVASSYENFCSFNKLNHRNVTFKILDQPLIVSPVVIYLRKHSYLTECFSKKLNSLKSGGIIDYWRNTFYETDLLKLKRSAAGPKAMTFKTLSSAFMGLLLGWVASLVVFIIEKTCCAIWRQFLIINSFTDILL